MRTGFALSELKHLLELLTFTILEINLRRSENLTATLLTLFIINIFRVDFFFFYLFSPRRLTAHWRPSFLVSYGEGGSERSLCSLLHIHNHVPLFSFFFGPPHGIQTSATVGTTSAKTSLHASREKKESASCETSK